MASRIIDLCKAVQRHVDDTEAIVRRMAVPIVDNLATDKLNIIVAPKAQSGGTLTRDTDRNLYQVDIGFIKHVGSDDGTINDTEVDRLIERVQQTIDRFNDYVPQDLDDANMVQWVNDPIYDAERMKTDRNFISVVTLTFEVES